MSPQLDQINGLFDAIKTKLEDNERVDKELLPHCLDLKEILIRIDSFSSEYDYKETIPGNGFASFIKMSLKFWSIVTECLEKNQFKTLNEDFVNISKVLIASGSLLLDFRKTSLDEKNETVSLLHLSKTEIFVKLMKSFSDELQKPLASIYGNYCSFWLSPSMRKNMKIFTTLMAMYATCSTKDTLKCFWNPVFRGSILSCVAHNANINFIKSFWQINEFSIFREAIPHMFFSQQPEIMREMFVERRQKRYIVSTAAERVTKHDDSKAQVFDDTKIRCRLICNKTIEENQVNLVLHCHGGGFVSQSPESHEVYLKDWAKQLVDIPILSVDYTLSPAGKYPEALQQMLDVYLWLTDTSNSDLLQTLGFYPKNIVIVGDSAGGNLAAAMCLVLNDIRSLYKDDVVMPKTIVCVYTPFMLKINPSPSKVLTAFDGLLPVGVLLSCLEAYVDLNSVSDEEELEVVSKTEAVTPSTGVEHVDEENPFEHTKLHFLTEKKASTPDEMDSTLDKDFVLIDFDEVPPDEDLVFQNPNDLTMRLQQTCYSAVKKLKEAIYGIHVPMLHMMKNFYVSPFLLLRRALVHPYLVMQNWSQLAIGEGVLTSAHTPLNPNKAPWYRCDDNTLLKRIRKINKICEKPYISPLLYENLDALEDVQLRLIAGEFDVCLDDSITMASKWKGRVSLDILEDLPHGFLNFVMFGEECKRASDLCVHRVKESFALF